MTAKPTAKQRLAEANQKKVEAFEAAKARALPAADDRRWPLFDPWREEILSVRSAPTNGATRATLPTLPS